MTKLLKDQAQRDRALDIQHSFIVHAPAGSGKTDLLVQRYLALLTQSFWPEAVQAWTFTRKAADEMRQRVLDTLQFVASCSTGPQQSDQYIRWKLGKKLYRWQAARGWNLLENTHRLQIQTIDAFYAQLASKAPTNFRPAAAHQVLEDPTPLYQEAIRELLAEIEMDSSLGKALIRLARHLNNDTAQIEKLLMHMLWHRDQWVDIIPKSSDDLSSLRLLLEGRLQAISQAAYKAAEVAFASCGIPDWHQQLERLVLACTVSEDKQQAKLSSSLFWSSLSDLLLTAKGEWRKTVSHKRLCGYSKSEQQALKASIKYWLNLLSGQEPLRVALSVIRLLPPTQYRPLQWELLSELFYVLRVLLTTLGLVFQKYEQVDYIAVALKAHQLLGESEDPTALLFKLDYQIQHILIDEFQDTSFQQLKFLTRLVEGWQPYDGRTLFLVGDPMQSIYRFRKAEARLFRLVQEQGIGSIELELITLSTNFRADSALVEWTNHHFEAMQRGCPEYNLFTPSIAYDSLKGSKAGGVQMHWLLNATVEQEAEQVITLVRQALAEASNRSTVDKTSIAILGRARQHILPILLKLRAQNIPCQAIEIESLGDKQVIKDLLALTRALSHLADDVAWLAILRAPWCGLNLSDLHTLMQACQSHHPSKLIWEQLQCLNKLTMADDSKVRLDRFVKVLAPMVENYGRAPLSERVLQAWYYLGGPATQPLHTWHFQDIDLFCQCVNEAQNGETLVDHAALENKLSKTYASVEGHRQAGGITLMTIHKAKGLEFDIVIVPGLHKSTRQGDYPLILFDEIPSIGPNSLLLAPIQASDAAKIDPIYRYLRQLDAQQEQAELLRLLYVACTRAKSQLHLVGSISHEDKKGALLTKPGTFLNWLWPVLAVSQRKVIQTSDIIATQGKGSWLRRMTLTSDYPRVKS